MLASRILIFPMFIVVSLFVGWFIPHFYVWTDSDQSRPSPLLWMVPLGLMIASCALLAVLPLLPIACNAPKCDTSQSKVRFSLGTLLILTAGIAVAIPLLAKFPLVTSGFIGAAAFVYFIAFYTRMQESPWLAILLTALELAIGIWVIRLGPKRTIAYLIMIFQMSAVGSLAFHILVLA